MDQLADDQRFSFAPLAPGAVDVLDSNCSLSIPGLRLERHLYWPGERAHASLPWHVIVVTRSRVTRGEHGNDRGGFVPFTKPWGAITIAPAGAVPPVRLTTPSEVVVCAFDPSALRAYRNEADGPKFPELGLFRATRDRDLSDLLGLLGREVDAGLPSGRLYVDGLSLSLFARVLALSCHPGRSLFRTRSRLGGPARERILGFMEAHLSRNIGLQELADQVGYSRGHFLKLFRNALGKTPHQYLAERRIERAKSLLTEGSLPLIDIAAACGFSSHAHFSTEFRRRVGIPPARYRRMR